MRDAQLLGLDEFAVVELRRLEAGAFFRTVFNESVITGLVCKLDDTVKMFHVFGSDKLQTDWHSLHSSGSFIASLPAVHLKTARISVDLASLCQEHATRGFNPIFFSGDVGYFRTVYERVSHYKIDITTGLWVNLGVQPTMCFDRWSLVLPGPDASTIMFDSLEPQP